MLRPPSPALPATSMQAGKFRLLLRPGLSLYNQFMTPNPQFCPICSNPIDSAPRYPRCVCSECAGKAASQDGRALKFYNLSLSGGFGASYADTGEPYDSHDCFIDGIKCRADEARFGGIVIEVVT